MTHLPDARGKAAFDVNQIKADEVDGSRSRPLSAKMGCYHATRAKEPSALEISTIGLDLAKNVFQIHAIDASGKIVVRKTLRRSQMLPFFEKLPPCLVGAEACGTLHHWARELTKLGHEVRLMPAAYVKPYVKHGKNDAADAEAICKADRTLFTDPIRASSLNRLHKQAGQTTAPDQTPHHHFMLATREPSTEVIPVTTQ